MKWPPGEASANLNMLTCMSEEVSTAFQNAIFAAHHPQKKTLFSMFRVLSKLNTKTLKHHHL